MKEREYQLTEEEWQKIKDLSAEAKKTPVMALSVADGLAGRDFASIARERVFSYWRVLADKYGFAAATVRPADENKRTISASFVREGRPAPPPPRYCVHMSSDDSVCGATDPLFQVAPLPGGRDEAFDACAQHLVELMLGDMDGRQEWDITAVPKIDGMPS